MNKEGNPYLLAIQCITYNQSAYISDAMDGFVMQQTNFPFVAVIIDDASTDGEQEVIKAYVEEHFDHSQESGFREWETEDAFFSFARHKENKNCHFVAVCLKRNLFKEPEKKDAVVKGWFEAKYMALCEGDDYWIDPLKLQKQVDFLEGHEEYSMCFHGAKIINECGAKVTTSFHTIREGDYGPNDIFPLWVVPTASVVYRNEMVRNYPIKHADWFVYGDIVLFEKCAHVCKVFGMNKEMSVYRMNANSLLQNPNYSQSRIMRMPYHFKAIKINFPKLDKKLLNKLIADSYYAKIRNEKSLLMKIIDFINFIFVSPCYSINKLYKKLEKRNK
jgi:glycosyltransferase involved in cell wall biosynthesis